MIKPEPKFTFHIDPEELARLDREKAKREYDRLMVQAKTGTQPVEHDPNGVDAHSPGAKLDAGKAEYDMVLFSFPDALAHVDRIGKFGARKYTKGGFLDVPNGQARYFNAEIRHAIKKLRGERNDPDSEELHLAHKAWNALAELQLFLEGKGA